MTTAITGAQRALSDAVAEEIRAWMARRRMSGRDLAKVLHVSPAWISYRLVGKQPIDLNDLQRIAAALQVSVADLLPSSVREISSAPTVRYAKKIESAPRPSPIRPVDNRPSGKPRSEITPGVNRTSRLPRPPQRKAA